jgi:hypothetical protein
MLEIQIGKVTSFRQGLREDLPAGTICYAELGFEIAPFLFAAVIVEYAIPRRKERLVIGFMMYPLHE